MLSSQRLADLLRPLFMPATMPMSAPDALDAWTRAYIPYSTDAMAGGTVLAAPLVPTPATGDFLTALDGVLRGMWSVATWVGPGLTGVTTLVPPLQPFFLSSSGLLLASPDRERAIVAIAQSIHTYTLSITVTVTSASGVTSVVPLA